MASNFHVQQPYVLTTLPRPLDHTDGRGKYVCAEVFGQQRGSKKRKRSEIAVGIDGDALNIYDVPSTRLVTSYPVPPDARFGCPPCSVRWKGPTGTDVTRYTYVSTAKQPAVKVTLFKESLSSKTATQSITTTSVSLSVTSPVIQLSIATGAQDAASATEASPNFDVLVVLRDGEVVSLDGETLQERWRTPSSLFSQGLREASPTLHVEYVTSACAADVISGIFAGQPDAFRIFQGDHDSTKSDVLLLVTRSSGPPDIERFFHVVAIPSASEMTGTGRPRLIQLHAVPLPNSPRKISEASSWQLDLRAGRLQEQRGSAVFAYDITSAVPKLDNTLEVPGLESCLRISGSALLASSPAAISVYNPIYRALQARTELEIPEKHQDDSSRLQDAQPCVFITYLRLLNLAVARKGASLVAVQLEAPLLKGRKRRAEGLLIDSIGRGIPNPLPVGPKPTLTEGFSSFVRIIPGALSRSYEDKWKTDVQRADDYLSKNDLAGFERLIAARLGMKLSGQPLQNGVRHTGDGDTDMGEEKAKEQTPPAWLWPEPPKGFPKADRTYVTFAISRMFSWQEARGADPVLRCQYPESNVLSYLVYSGSLTVANLQSAFREQLQEKHNADTNIAEQLTRELATADPLLGLLLAYLDATPLGPVEVLMATRLVLYSLELVATPAGKRGQKLLTFGEMDNGAEDDVMTNGHNGAAGEADESTVIGMELDRLEEELEVTAAYLGNDTFAGSTRTRCLSTAFAQLGACPAAPTVQALRALYKPEEILALTQVLRVELIKDGWTTRYQDTNSTTTGNSTGANTETEADDPPPPDGSIRLIADLLCRCIDAVGPAGWLVNDAVLAAGGAAGGDLTMMGGSADFLAALKLEVSAALEGIQEAVYLRGMLAETVRYGLSAQNALKAAGGGSGTRKDRKERKEKQGGEGQQGGGDASAASLSDPGSALAVVTSNQLQLQQPVAVTTDMLPQMLPLGLKVRHGVSPDKVISGGEVVQRSRRERGHLTSQQVGAYSVERIVI